MWVTLNWFNWGRFPLEKLLENILRNINPFFSLTRVVNDSFGIQIREIERNLEKKQKHFRIEQIPNMETKDTKMAIFGRARRKRGDYFM